MSSNWRVLVVVVATILIGWFAVRQHSIGQDDLGELEYDAFGPVDEVPAAARVEDKTLIAIPNAVGDPRVQWEYKVMSRNEFDESTANNLGTEGWELVTFYRHTDADVRAVFKRPKQ